MSMFKSVIHSLRGTNLEVFKFGMYIMFPIGWMYYFGTNLEGRFKVPDFWPSQEQSHKIPYEKEDIKSELDRLRARREQQDDVVKRRLQEAREGKRSLGAET